MNSFVEAITAGLRGVGQKSWCNRGATRMLEGSAAWRALDAGANPPDVLMEEGAFAVGWGPAAVQFYAESEWKRSVDTMGAIRNSKVAMLSHTKLSEDQTGTDSWGQPVTFWQTLWYSLGSFLLSKNDDLGNAYFMFHGSSGYNKILWFDEYDKIDLGKAKMTRRIEQTAPSVTYTPGWGQDGGSRRARKRPSPSPGRRSAGLARAVPRPGSPAWCWMECSLPRSIRITPPKKSRRTSSARRAWQPGFMP